MLTATQTRARAKVIQILKVAADQGHTRAQFALGSMYHKCQISPHSYKGALAWFLKAADQRNADAQFNLDAMHVDGQGVV